MHYQVWPQLKGDKLLWRISAHPNIDIFCSEGEPTDHSTSWQAHWTTHQRRTMLWARLALSMQQSASGWQSSSWLRGSGGQMEAPHGSHALKIRAEGGEEGATNSPQMEGWGVCGKEEVAGRTGRALNVLKSCTVLPNTKQLHKKINKFIVPTELRKKRGQNCKSDCGACQGLNVEEPSLFSYESLTNQEL